MTIRLPAEWEEQDGVLLAWPHIDSDWGPVLPLVEPVFVRIALEISRFEQLLIVAPDPAPVHAALAQVGVAPGRFRIEALPTNDTWSRDFGPLTVLRNGQPQLIDAGFNGWGLKFPCNHDNRVSRKLAERGVFGDTPLKTTGLILEGGSIESDGQGTLLTTSECLLEANRNPHLDRTGLEQALAGLLGIDHFLWLEHGYLAGDDTDSHIDTLARLCPEDTIIHVACDDPADEHFSALQRMAEQLRGFRTRTGQPFRLLPLPWPRARYDDEGQRLPATYANYLVINGAVLVPTYADPHDARALAVIGKAFPGRAIIGIDCSPLILQHGSLHCVTMQLPRGVLA